MGWIERREVGAGVRYKVSWREPDRTIRSKTFRRRSDADGYLKTVEVRLLSGMYLSPTRGRMRLREYWEQTRTDLNSAAPATRALYDLHWRLYILPGLGGYPLAEITRPVVREFLDTLRRDGRGHGTVDTTHRILRRTLGCAVEDGLMPGNPAVRMRATSVHRPQSRFLSVAEVETLAAAVPPRFRALVYVLSYCGLRIGEASALTMRAVDLRSGVLSIEQAASEVNGHRHLGPTKSRRMRSVTMPPFLAEELRHHIDQYISVWRPDDWLFSGSRGGPVTQSGFRRNIFRPACERCGIQPVPRVHDLRHTAAALAVEAQVHPKAIQEMLGHASIRTTLDTYGHLFKGAQNVTADRMNELRQQSIAQDDRLNGGPNATHLRVVK